MFDMRNFKPLISEYAVNRVDKNTPKITFSTDNNYIGFNKKALKLVNSPKVVLMYDAINQLIAVMPTNLNPKGARAFCTPSTMKIGFAKMTDPEILNLFRNCDSVSQNGLYHFDGEWDDESSVLIFDLKKGQYIGKTKRKNRLNRRYDEQIEVDTDNDDRSRII